MLRYPKQGKFCRAQVKVYLHPNINTYLLGFPSPDYKVLKRRPFGAKVVLRACLFVAGPLDLGVSLGYRLGVRV